MKKLCSLFALIALLFTVSGCEDDYRSMVLFEGVEPIYQVGTCDNLVSVVTLYLAKPDGIVLGIDGGDGAYALEGGDAAIATVAFTEDMNGYRRVKVQPVGEGVINVVVKDGSGGMAVLKVVVKDCYKFHCFVQQIGYHCSAELEEKHWNQIRVDLTAAMTMKCEGNYTLIPADEENPWYGGGKLRVHASALVSGFMEGTYEMVEVDEGKRRGCRFSYNGEVHDFFYEPLEYSDTKASPVPSVVFYEDVTSLVTASLPQGCRVYRLEQWMYLLDEIMTGR